jgi:hypothetical protein
MPAVHSSPSPSSSTSWLRKDFAPNGPRSALIHNSQQSRGSHDRLEIRLQRLVAILVEARSRTNRTATVGRPFDILAGGELVPS